MKAEVPAPLKQVRLRFDAKAAKRAIYVDYEGRPHNAPVLLGWRTLRDSGCSIVDPRFETCAHRWRARHVDVREHRELLSELLGMAANGRRIVSWSLHDYQIMMQTLDEPQQAVLRRVYVNALAVVRPWYRREAGCVLKEAYSLPNLRKLFGLAVPEAYGEGVVGRPLQALEGRFEDALGYGDLTTEDRALWVAIVKHNRLDIDHMQHIVLGITQGVRLADLPGA